MSILFKHIFYRPHPKDGEGNVFTLSTPAGGGGGSGQSADGGGGGVGQVSQPTGGGVSGQSADRGGGGGCQVQLARGGVRSSWQGGSASCALWRTVCLLRSCRRTFLLIHKKDIMKMYLRCCVVRCRCIECGVANNCEHFGHETLSRSVTFKLFCLFFSNSTQHVCWM